MLVRADLGQIEPRVLAAVSGDVALIAATRRTNVSAGGEPAAVTTTTRRWRCWRNVRGDHRDSAQACTGSSALSDGDAISRRRPPPDGPGRTCTRLADDGYGWGRRFGGGRYRSCSERRGRTGRFARNAMVQGAAAEFFKVWAVTVRIARGGWRRSCCACTTNCWCSAVRTQARGVSGGGTRPGGGLGPWSPHRDVRFVADVSVVHRWSEAT